MIQQKTICVIIGHQGQQIFGDKIKAITKTTVIHVLMVSIHSLNASKLKWYRYTHTCTCVLYALPNISKFFEGHLTNLHWQRNISTFLQPYIIDYLFKRTPVRTDNVRPHRTDKSDIKFNQSGIAQCLDRPYHTSFFGLKSLMFLISQFLMEQTESGQFWAQTKLGPHLLPLIPALSLKHPRMTAQHSRFYKTSWSQFVQKRHWIALIQFTECG